MSEFWARKIRTHFHFLDVDKNGILTRNDYLLFGDRFIEKENPDLRRQKKIREALENMWQGYIKLFGSEENIALTESEFIESVRTQRNNPQFLAKVRDVCYNFVEAVDTNEDGFLQEDEYERFWESLGVPDAVKSARVSFKAVDTNGDGKLSLDEICAACIDFFSSEDESSPYQLFFGPLI